MSFNLCINCHYKRIFTNCIRILSCFQNTGSKAATDITITDVLPAGMNYDSDAEWSLGSLALTDANEETQAAAPSIVYCAYDVSCTTQNQVLIIGKELSSAYRCVFLCLCLCLCGMTYMLLTVCMKYKHRKSVKRLTRRYKI